MAGGTAGFVALVLLNIILINSEDEVSTRLPRLWKVIMSTESRAGINDENQDQPKGTSTVSFAGHFASTGSEDLERMVYTEKANRENYNQPGEVSTMSFADHFASIGSDETVVNTEKASRENYKQPRGVSTVSFADIVATTSGEETTADTENAHRHESEGTLVPTWAKNSMTTGPTIRTTTVQTLARGSNACTTYTIAMQGVIPVIVCAVGIVGNAMCILVFWGDRNKSATHTLLLQLAVADTTVLVTWPVMLMTQTLYLFYDNLDSHFVDTFPYVRKYGWGIANTCQMVACWLVVVITAQRYIAVCHPHKMRFLGKPRIAWIIFAVVVVFCIPFNLMRWLEYDVIVRDGKVDLIYSNLGGNPSYQVYFKGVAYYFLIFIAPVSLLLFFTVALIRQLNKSKRKVNVQPQPTANPGATANEAKKKQGKKQTSTDEITFALIVVDIVFIICQTINPLRRLLDYLQVDFRTCGSAYSLFRPTTGVFIVFNSAINFVVFCLCAKGFRSQVLERVCGKKVSTNGPSSVATKQTTVAP